MKLFLQVLFFLLIVVEMFSTISAYANVCKYERKQMTIGQSVIDCHAITTCKQGGVLKRRNPCALYSCVRNKLGYKMFDSRKPYPDCCGGPVCKDEYKTYYYHPSKAYY